MNFSRSLVLCFAAVLAASLPCSGRAAEAPDSRPNILIITVDDMSADSLGAFGCKLPDTSPHIDRLASAGMKFNLAHAQAGNCMPSRNVMWSGRYTHHNRIEGFYQVRDVKYPVLTDLMKGGGYFTGIRGKVAHSTPYSPYKWDLDLDDGPDGKKVHVKDAPSYEVSTTQGIQAAKSAGKPFCLMINVSDPHKPFYAEGNRGETIPDEHVPSRVFTPEEVPIPGFLFDDPVVRKELSHYYSSVRRADDCVGAILTALKKSGEDERTLILFLSDHGMPLPFAKTQLYHHSTRTPLIVRWPGITKAGSVDETNMVSAVDFLPTLLDAAGITHPTGLDGSSFAPLLRNTSQEGRDFIVKGHTENAGRSRDPMRAIQTKKYLYIFNAWSNGTRVMATATSGTSTYRRMVALAKTDSKIAGRLEVYQHRTMEELYDVEQDPDCLHNLIGHTTHAKDADTMRQMLESWMVKYEDPMLEIFRKRGDAAAREAWVAIQEKEAEERVGGKKGGKKRAGKATPDDE
ncbi:N-sulfoglucosamine sulfohydrolase [Roseimicrobium gellanilyticum]|uniref:N-sulfoglucosamine sulfohydrolase n=1 Tax=Roseimicrobium gellanilyticum TaxID=748857 RepID=A0A366HG18_9BACT|nr:sulfatase [Roseimicrobium gellanilyticum]RBP41502.1 N-sulfoglucosamine sulfohydrolase [Roseimicrobium gellanilyticum]